MEYLPEKSHINIDVQKYTVLRRKFHRIPEIGYKEFETKSLILETLKLIDNFEQYSKITEAGATGFFIDIYGRKIVPMEESSTKMLISFRTDLDGLPFKEESELEYQSTHEKMIHGCGHDGHITILIATIEYYLKYLDRIPENFGVRFLFQPAEEGLFGAKVMVDNGCLDNVNEIYGLHNMTTFKLGEIGVIPGTIMAGNQRFEISLKGKGGHSSTPHKCHNPINTGSQIINAINQITSQEIDSKDRHAIGIGCFQSGDTHNVIPEYGVIKGTLRYSDNKTGDIIINRIKEISETIGLLNHCLATFSLSQLQCTINHKEQTELIEKISKEHFKLETHDLPIMASEDFGYYLEKIPGCFFMLGVGDDSHSEYLHTPQYDFNDLGIPIGVEMFIRIVEEKTLVKLI